MLALVKYPGSFIIEIIKEKLGDGFSIFSKEEFKTFEKAKSIKDQKTSEAKSTANGKVDNVTSAANDKSKGFFFTENLQAYLANRGRGAEVSFDLAPKDVKLDVTATNNQAGIRQTNGQRQSNYHTGLRKDCVRHDR
jgi:hypothetical protein